MGLEINLHFHEFVVKQHPELLWYESGARDVMRRLPPRVFQVDFSFRVTSHHLVRLANSHIAKTTVVDGHLKGKKIEHPHSWLSTENQDFIVDVFPYGFGMEPHLIYVGAEAPWGTIYDASRTPNRVRIPGFEQEVTELLEILHRSQVFYSYP